MKEETTPASVEEKIKKWEEIKTEYDKWLPTIDLKWRKGETVYTQMSQIFPAIIDDFKELKEYGQAKDKEILKYGETIRWLALKKFELQSQLTAKEAENRELKEKCEADHCSIDELLSEFNRRGINTENWDGDTGAEEAIVNGVCFYLEERQEKLFDMMTDDQIKFNEAKHKLQAELKYYRELAEAGDFAYSKLMAWYCEKLSVEGFQESAGAYTKWQALKNQKPNSEQEVQESDTTKLNSSTSDDTINPES